LTVKLVGKAPPGLQLAPDGSFTYLPRVDFLGDVTFKVEVSDDLLTTKPITIKIRAATGNRGQGG